MQFSSLSDSNIKRSFAEAVVEGLAPDRGLYFPDHIPELPEAFWFSHEDKNPWDLGAEMLAPYTEGCLTKEELREILRDVLNFPIPLHEIERGVFSLELFHGPTSAFKDVGARFLSRVLSRITNLRLTILVATSGDTGSAVANGFLGVPNIDVVILYPSGRISKIQEQQLTTAGSNIVALEVEGSFDQCQEMVKSAFLDSSLQSVRALTSANSINIARWMPQSIYYAWATYQLGKPAVFSVPSGNFGNIAAGLLAAKMGMPVAGFVAATNANDGMEKYLS
ncbi:MAG: threonine synthase, partial [Flavobacteriales bacterium]